MSSGGKTCGPTLDGQCDPHECALAADCPVNGYWCAAEAPCASHDPYHDRACCGKATCAYNTGCLESSYCLKTGKARLLVQSIVVPINNDEFD